MVDERAAALGTARSRPEEAGERAHVLPQACSSRTLHQAEKINPPFTQHQQQGPDGLADGRQMLPTASKRAEVEAFSSEPPQSASCPWPPRPLARLPAPLRDRWLSAHGGRALAQAQPARPPPAPQCLAGDAGRCAAMAQQAQATRNTITIKGSTKIVTEFFAYAVNRRARAAAAAALGPAGGPRAGAQTPRWAAYTPGPARAQRPVPARRVPARLVRAAEALRADDDGDHRPGRRAVPEQRAAADVRRAGRTCFHRQERAGLFASEARAAGADWLLEGQLQKMVLVVTSIASQEVLERWAFDIQTSRAPAGGGRAAPHGSAHAGGRLLRGATVIALHDRRRRCAWARRPGRRPRSRRARSRPRYRPSSGRRALLGPPAAAARARTLPGRARTLPGRARTLRGADSTEPRPQGHPVTRAQITASVTFLPLLQDACTFDLLVYADSDSPVPGEWCARPGAAPPGSGERRPRGAGGCVRACGLTADLPAASMSRPAYLHAPQARCLCRPSPACCRPRAYLADHQ